MYVLYIFMYYLHMNINKVFLIIKNYSQNVNFDHIFHKIYTQKIGFKTMKLIR